MKVTRDAQTGKPVTYTKHAFPKVRSGFQMLGFFFVVVIIVSILAALVHA